MNIATKQTITKFDLDLMKKLVTRGGIRKAFDIGERRINPNQKPTSLVINEQLPKLFPEPLPVALQD